MPKGPRSQVNFPPPPPTISQGLAISGKHNHRDTYRKSNSFQSFYVNMFVIYTSICVTFIHQRKQICKLLAYNKKVKKYQSKRLWGRGGNKNAKTKEQLFKICIRLVEHTHYNVREPWFKLLIPTWGGSLFLSLLPPSFPNARDKMSPFR